MENEMSIHDELVAIQRAQENALLVEFHRRLKSILDEEAVWIANIQDIINHIVDEMVPNQARPTATMWLAWDMPDPNRWGITMEHNAEIEDRMRLGLWMAYSNFLSEYDVTGISVMVHEGTMLEVEDSLQRRDLIGATIYDNGAKHYGVLNA